MNWIRSSRLLTGYLGMMLFVAMQVSAQSPSPTLLALEKSDNTLAIVDPASLQVVARVPAGQAPHEVIASDDGKLAYISNYGGEGSTLNTIAVVDLVARKALPPIDLGALNWRCSTRQLAKRSSCSAWEAAQQASWSRPMAGVPMSPSARMAISRLWI